MIRKKKKKVAFWSETVGMIPHRVTVEERPSHGFALYLRWWNASKSNWQRMSLSRALQSANLGTTSLRDSQGVIVDRVAAWALEQAWTQYRRLAGLTVDDAVTVSAPLTISQAWGIITNPDTGLYPSDTAHRREVKAALEFAGVIWGESTPWGP